MKRGCEVQMQGLSFCQISKAGANCQIEDEIPKKIFHPSHFLMLSLKRGDMILPFTLEQMHAHSHTSACMYTTSSILHLHLQKSFLQNPGNYAKKIFGLRQFADLATQKGKFRLLFPVARQIFAPSLLTAYSKLSTQEHEYGCSVGPAEGFFPQQMLVFSCMQDTVCMYFPLLSTICTHTINTLQIPMQTELNASLFAMNTHGLLVLFNAFVKMSCGFVGAQLLFLLSAHLPCEMRSPRSLSKPVSHALESKVT